MMRLIDADALLDGLEKLYRRRELNAAYNGYRGSTVTWNDAIFAIKSAPTASDWDRYSTKLWKEAYERGKRDAQPEVAKDTNVPSTDCISRQAAIDALRMDIDIIPYAKAREYARAVIETVYNRLEHLPAAQPQWIPVSERLPKEEGYFFVTDEAAGMAETLIDKYLQCDDGEWVWLYSQRVVAWMPLPEPYKED